MSDSIAYRLPGATSIVVKSGKFSLLKNSEAPSGFVVSDFLHQRIYQFTEAETEYAALHFLKEAPVVIAKRDYQIEAGALLNAFSVMEVEKAVYSRVKAVSFPLKKGRALFHELVKAYPDAFVYLISSPEFGTWIGATPEVLIDVAEDELKTVALAGTHAAGDTSYWTIKEQEEHAFVVDAVVRTLKRNHCFAIEQDGPDAVSAGPVQHLKTNFTARLGGTPAWKIAMDLHPTPAVCGTPRMASLDLIVSREMHDRFLYAGVIGIHMENSTRLFVNLRCAQLQQEKAYLYVGGGYTIDSIPDLEWEETENKAKTLLNCMEKL